jgi:O-antigen/teichoic acid export membrane protein
MNWLPLLKRTSCTNRTALEFLTKGASALAAKIAGTAFSFIFLVWLSRSLGRESAGSYFLALNIATVISTIARFGLDNAVTRSAAQAFAEKDQNSLKGIFLTSVVFILVVSFFSTILLILLSSSIGVMFRNPALPPALRVMALSTIPVALYTICFQFLQGIGSTQAAVNISTIWPQFASLSLLAPALYFFPNNAGPIAYTLGAVFALAMAYRCISNHVLLSWRGVAPNYEQRSLFRMGRVLFVASICELCITWAPSILVGLLSSPGNVALFSVAQRITMLIGFLFVSINMIATPKLAMCYVNSDLRGVAQTIKRSAVMMTAGALPLFLLCLFASKIILNVFGKGFVDAANILLILAIGQMASVVTGPVASTLIMCGLERTYRNLQILAGVFCVASLGLATPAFGPCGAALAVASTNWLQKLLCAYFVWRKLRGYAQPQFLVEP